MHRAFALLVWALALAGAAVVGAWVELDVTPAITSNGVVSFGIQSLSDDSVRYSSKEGADPPELVVELEPTAAPPACDDGVDNDGDGFTDFPDDPSCKTALGVAESARPRCGLGFELALLLPILRARRARVLARVLRRASRAGM